MSFRCFSPLTLSPSIEVCSNISQTACSQLVKTVCYISLCKRLVHLLPKFLFTFLQWQKTMNALCCGLEVFKLWKSDANSILRKILNYWVFGLCWSSLILKIENQCFGNCICFHPQVRAEKPILLGPLERANPNHWTRHVSISTAI
jgi:hypothetical protein